MLILDLGFTHYIDAQKIINICKPGSSPIRKQIATAREEGRFVDCTEGRITRSIIFSSCGDKVIITSSTIMTTTLQERINKLKKAEEEMKHSIKNGVVPKNEHLIEKGLPN